MATAMKKCKVCGCEYEYCHTARHIAGVFRWQDVACSPEHGSIYLSRIESSRGNQAKDDDEKAVCEFDNSNIECVEDDESDDLFDADFEDSLEEIAIEK